MELRAEPRFGTLSRAVIEVIRDKVYTYDSTITEVSGIGLRIEMAEELAVGEDIRVTVNNYLLLGRVRRCIPSDSGFTIGIERIDDWDELQAESASVPSRAATTSPAKVLGRPKLKNPLDNLRGAALKALFADPRLRTRETKYQAVAIAAGCIALAGWAGFSLHGKPHGLTPAQTEAAKQLPGVPKSTGPAVPKTAADVAPLKTATINLAATKISSPAVSVPPLQKAPVQVPPVQKAEVVAPPKLAAHPALAPVSKISITASDVSWVTACVDGAKVLDTLLSKGYTGAIPFSRQAIVRFGNAGAIELAIGNQPAAKLGPSGEVRTIKATSAGYELMTVRSALNCNLY